MQNFLLKSLFLLIIIVPFVASAQTFDGVWSCDYATYDTTPEDNAIGQNCISVKAIKENTFVALSQRGASASVRSTNFLVGYTNADSANGRMGTHYGSRGDRQTWSFGFEEPIEMVQAMDIAVTKDSLIYVPNNDPERNILVFRMGADSVLPADHRLATGVDSLWAIHVDGNGRVYVASIKDRTQSPCEVLVYRSIAEDDNAWSVTFSGTPMTTITMPDTGDIYGITSNADGTVLYISNYHSKKIYCFTGNPETGYTLYNRFNLQFDDPRTTDDGLTTFYPGPLGVTLLPDKNILVFAADMSTVTTLLSIYYQYGKIFFANPNTGDLLDTIDVALWNYEMLGGSYTNRIGGYIPGNASGYTSTFNVSYDEAFNLYSQSYNGWTAEKWSYSGTLPTIPDDISSVKRDNSGIPSNFYLEQNYPNPFNPSTVIKFGLTESNTVDLRVYDILGREVAVLVNNQFMEAGSYNTTFNAEGLSSGIYIYRIIAGNNTSSLKMQLLK